MLQKYKKLFYDVFFFFFFAYLVYFAFIPKVNVLLSVELDW